jgi:hypothetical protein
MCSDHFKNRKCAQLMKLPPHISICSPLIDYYHFTQSGAVHGRVCKAAMAIGFLKEADVGAAEAAVPVVVHGCDCRMVCSRHSFFRIALCGPVTTCHRGAAWVSP